MPNLSTTITRNTRLGLLAAQIEQIGELLDALAAIQTSISAKITELVEEADQSQEREAVEDLSKK